MQGDYISIANFEHYKATRAKAALEVVGTNLRNENKLNQVAARMLGYSSYEALQPFHFREKAILEGVYAEQCPIQRGLFTIKAKNIIAVFNAPAQKILVRVLFPGQEREVVTEENATRIIFLNAEDDLGYDFTPVVDSLAYNSEAEGNRLSFQFTSKNIAKGKDGVKGPVGPFTNQCDAIATDEGLILNLYADVDGDFAELDSVALEYVDDVNAEQAAAVDQVTAPYMAQAAGLDGHFFHFRAVGADPNGQPRLLAQEWDDKMMPLTDFIFASKKDAKDFLDSEDWPYGWDDLEGLVLTEVTQKIVPF